MTTYGDVLEKNTAHSVCPQLPGTILRIFIPAGAVINLLNLVEVASPGGICLIIRIPLLGGLLGEEHGDLHKLLDGVKKAGGRIEILNEAG